MELTTAERLLLLAVAEAGADGICVDVAIRRVQEVSRETDGVWLGPFLPPWYGLHDIASRLEDLGLILVDYPVADMGYAPPVAQTMPLACFEITDAGRQTADGLRRV